VSPPNLRWILIATSLCLTLCACGQGVKSPVKLPQIHLPGQASFDSDRLEGAIDRGFGGIGACMIIADAGSGREVYRYNSNAACMNPLPPCATFDIPNTLIGLDEGLITPETKYKWDGSPQPVVAWRHDADLTEAFKASIPWWFQRLAGEIGVPRFQEQLKALDYGNHSVGGPPTAFWLGPAAGGQLLISARQQAQFLHRLYAGKLPVKPRAAAVVQQLMQDETRGDYTVSGQMGDCPSLADSSERVSWWIGHLKGPRSEYVFAISMDQPTGSSLPASEVRVRAKSAFAQAGLWPAE
jgi:beta-lactamase class D